VIFALIDATVLGIAAAVSTLIGIVLAVASYISGRRTAAEQAAEDAHAKVMAANAEAERLAEELRKLKAERAGEEHD